MTRYRIKPFAALPEAPAWVEAGKEYEGEVDLLSPNFMGRRVELKEPGGQRRYRIPEFDLERLP